MQFLRSAGLSSDRPTDSSAVPTAKLATSESSPGREVREDAVEWVDDESPQELPSIFVGNAPREGHPVPVDRECGTGHHAEARCEVEGQEPRFLKERRRSDPRSSLRTAKPLVHLPSFPMVDW